MMFLVNDILVRGRKNNETVWVSERLLISVLGIDETYFRRKARNRFIKTVPKSRQDRDIMPDTGASWRFAKINGAWYYDLDWIPDVAPANYRTKLGGKDELIAAYEASLTDKKNTDMETYIRAEVDKYTGFFPYYPGYDNAKTVQLAKSAAALQGMYKYILEYEVDTRKNDVFIALGEFVNAQKLAYLPVNFRRLKDKVMLMLDGHVAHEVVKLPREGNNNASKNYDPQLFAWLMVMRSSGFNTTNAHIARRVSTLCALNDLRSPSHSWLEHYLSSTEVKNLTARRYGNGRLAMNYNGYIPIKGAAYAGDCWMMDGTRVNFLEFTHDGKAWSHLTVVMVYDAYSGAMLARSYGTAENRWLYQDALSKAATKCGYLPYEVIIDRFPGHNTEEWAAMEMKIRSVGTRIDTVHTMQGKARMERSIDVVQMSGLQYSDKYYGQGIMSRRDYAHRSDETLAEMRKKAREEGWDINRAIEEAERAFERYNNTPYNEMSAKRTITQSPIQLHTESDKPYTYKATSFEMLYLFGYSKRIQVRNMGMIVTEIDKKKYTYVTSADDWTKIRKHKEVIMYYDMADLTRVNLYTVGNEEFICEGTEQNAIQWHGPAKDGSAMGKARKRIADIREQNKKEMQEYEVLAGDEAILLGIGSAKSDREAAETAWLIGRVKAHKVGEHSVQEDELVVVNPRDLY